MQGPAQGEAAGTGRRLQDAVDISIPGRVKAEDTNKYLEVAFGNTFEPLHETTEGSVSLVSPRKTADTVRKGSDIGGDIKARTKRKWEANTSDEIASINDAQQD